MAGEQKLFLRKVAESWKEEFPFFRPVHLGGAVRDPKGSTFLCDDYSDSRSMWYFFQIDFSPRRRGEFSASIYISPNKDRAGVSIPESTTPTAMSVGVYAIWHFMGQPRYSWALIDDDSQMDAMLTSAGGEPINAGLPGRTKYVWKPATYDQPVDKTIDQAIAHLNETIRMHILPKLGIR
jgi:hypothetical protein